METARLIPALISQSPSKGLVELPLGLSSRFFKMLQLVGLGLADETDVTVKGLELIKKAERVYLEAYTSILLVDVARLVSLVQSVWG